MASKPVWWYSVLNIVSSIYIYSHFLRFVCTWHLNFLQTSDLYLQQCCGTQKLWGRQIAQNANYFITLPCLFLQWKRSCVYHGGVALTTIHEQQLLYMCLATFQHSMAVQWIFKFGVLDFLIKGGSAPFTSWDNYIFNAEKTIHEATESSEKCINTKLCLFFSAQEKVDILDRFVFFTGQRESLKLIKQNKKKNSSHVGSRHTTKQKIHNKTYE